MHLKNGSFDLYVKYVKSRYKTIKILHDGDDLAMSTKHKLGRKDVIQFLHFRPVQSSFGFRFYEESNWSLEKQFDITRQHGGIAWSFSFSIFTLTDLTSSNKSQRLLTYLSYSCFGAHFFFVYLRQLLEWFVIHVWYVLHKEISLEDYFLLSWIIAFLFCSAVDM